MSSSAAQCRVCGLDLPHPAFDDPGPSISSIRTVLPVSTQVFLCPECGHAQSPDLPDLQEFYDTQYRISLDIDGHDQLYETADGRRVMRTDFQAGIVLDLDLPHGARVLDFGAGKATTLRKVRDARPDLVPHVFDVSRDYVSHWNEWLPETAQATYELPETWSGGFDLITAHFVLEHVPSPVTILRDLRRCLAPGGRLFFTVPDVAGNTGDLLVVDHLNHFTVSSLRRALRDAGLRAISIESATFAGAFAVLAEAGDGQETAAELPDFVSILEAWSARFATLRELEAPGPLAIYGAGFYGSVMAARLGDRVECFLDRNPYLIGRPHFGKPVLNPDSCPTTIRTVIAALNPDRARAILGDRPDWLPEGATLVFL